MKRELKIAAAVLLALMLGVVANVQADSMRSKTGYPLTYQLNGSAVYLGTLNDAAPGTFTDNATTSTPFAISDSAFIIVQCDVAVYIINLAYNAANATTAKSMKLAADEKFLVGALQAGTAKLSIDSVSGAAVCKVFELK
jgi:hypothetical protein